MMAEDIVAPTNQSQDQNQRTDKSLYKSPDFQNQISLINSVIDNMLSGASKRLMIGGDTGLGKSSFVRQFAKIFGFPTIVIEIPHTVEEQLINIPFIVTDARGNTQQGYDRIDARGVTVELGTSYLASELKKMNKLSDAEYASEVKKYDSNLQELIAAFEEENPGEIARIRARYNRILFLDEFFRQTTPAIRNILRNILNGRIGNDPIPAGTYVMYASNLEDVGGSMDPQSQHTSFINLEFKAPSKEEWLSYTVSRALQSKVQLKKDVVDVFDKTLQDENISYNDIATGIRTSPRRWSEIFAYINNHYPFKSPETVGILITTIKRQFQTDEGTTSALYTVLNGMLEELTIKSNINPATVRTVSPTEWRQVLAQQIMTAADVGEMKKYVPVIQGLPGVGKTAIGEMFEDPPYNMRFIPILATTLTRDSVIGIPLPEKEKEKMGVTFAAPELYIKIMNMIEEQDRDYFNELKEDEKSGELKGRTAEEVYKDYQNQRYKYLIFFDEINRVKDVSIFNSLRRLILEKEFNNQYKLPKECLMLGAMNPSDLGTQPLTSHFRDAIDLIDVEPNWKDTLTFLKNQVIPYIKSLNNPSDISITTAEKIIEEFPKVFTDKKRGRTSNEFYINAGSTEVYLSPRDYDNLFRELVSGIDRIVRSVSQKIKKNISFSNDEINSKIINVAIEKIKGTLSERFYQAGMEIPLGFMDKVYKMLEDIVDVSLVKERTKAGLSSIFSEVLDGTTVLKDDFDFDNYMTGYTPATFTKDFNEFLIDNFKDLSTPPAIENALSAVATVASQIKEAVTQNDLNPDVFDRVEDVAHDFLNNIISSLDKENINFAYDIAKKYLDLLNTLGK